VITYAGGVDEKWLDGPAMRMARAWFTLNTLGTTIGKNHFDPAFWKYEDAQVKIVIYYNRHVIKQSRDTRP
jgi:hypothetical protein